MPESLDTGRVLAKAFRILNAELTLFLTLAYLIFSPWLVAQTLLLSVSTGATMLVSIAFTLLTSCVFGPLLTATLVFGVFQRLQGRSATVQESLQVGFQKAAAIILAGVAMYVGTVLGMCLLLIPGLILASGWYVVIPVLVAEKSTPTEALRRSWELTRNHRWRTFALYLFVALIGLAVVAAKNYLAEDVPDLLVSVILIPLSAYAAVLQGVTYHELRALKEGLGVDELAAVFD